MPYVRILSHQVNQAHDLQINGASHKTAPSLHWYVDDLGFCMKDPQSFCDTLNEVYKLKLKCIGPLTYHLDCGYTRDEDEHLLQIQGNMLTRFF